MVLGTSLTFHRGFQAHEKLLERLRQIGLPMVSSTPAAFWAAMRLVGENGKLSRYGKLFETVR